MKCNRIPASYIFVFFAFMATFNLYALRLNLSVAIVDMVEQSPVHNDTENTTTASTPTSKMMVVLEALNGSDLIDPINGGDVDKKFLWDESQQGFLLSAYFYGYMFTQVPGAYIGRRFGRVKVLGLCVFTSSTLTILFPIFVSNAGFYVTVAARVFIGLFSGVTVPILYAMASAWAPRTEKSKFTSIMFAGIPTGTCVVLPLSGLLVDAFGWESIFYVTGSFGLLWMVLWCAMIYDNPEDHPKLTISEKRLYGFENKQEREIRNNQDSQQAVPWISMLTSKAWICIAIPHFSNLFGRYLLMTMLPSYLNAILNIDIKSSGILSAIPFMLGTLVLFGSGPFADFLIAKNFKSICVRKALTTIGLLTSCVAISIVAYIGSSVPLAMTLFAVAVAMDSLIVPGYKTCLMEITPEFSGIAYGMSNTVATLSGVLAPLITGVLRKKFNHDPIAGWRASFWIGGAIYFLGAMVFLIFGTNKKQPWSCQKSNDVIEEELKSLDA